jgi:hypothetical protein
MDPHIAESDEANFCHGAHLFQQIVVEATLSARGLQMKPSLAICAARAQFHISDAAPV